MPPARAPTDEPRQRASHGLTPNCTIRRAVIIADMARTEPTDRSMPPVMITMVMPIATMLMVDMLRSTLKMFCGSRK